MKKITRDEAEFIRTKRRAELKQMLDSTTLPKIKNLSPDFIRKLLLDYLEACNNDAARIVKSIPMKGELYMFNFGARMALKEIIKELGQEEAMSKLERSILDYHFQKNMKEETRLSRLKYSIKKLFRYRFYNKFIRHG